ncbi:hypothetical protein LXA43DRAFT_1015535 [Ganoderma leucocontextum]|nr:hypothetical protein LXA43DRAFT_1015535 [Ganoderma leucocontextum]
MIYSAAICRWGPIVWGVTEEYLKTNVFPDASDSVELGGVADDPPSGSLLLHSHGSCP